MNAHQVRSFKMKSGRFVERVIGIFKKPAEETSDTTAAAGTIVSGDRVRVRSIEEIRATLNKWGQLRGCMFMPEMEPYCGTVQRVLKPLERFVDERDYHLKQTRGIILLEGLNCQGTSDYGRCDRHCFYFWREEWLEKIDKPEGVSASTDHAVVSRTYNEGMGAPTARSGGEAGFTDVR